MPQLANDYITALDDNEWIRDFARKWIFNQDGAGMDEALSDEVTDMEISLRLAEADTKLAVIVAISLLLQEGRHAPLLAAGMLEDFLVDHGEEYIGVIGEIARREPKFHHLLAGVWRNSMTENVWLKVQALRGPAW